MNLAILHRWRQEGMPWPLYGVDCLETEWRNQRSGTGLDSPAFDLPMELECPRRCNL
jgi:hypothetical protein